MANKAKAIIPKRIAIVTIKAWTIRNTLIEWNYDNDQQAAPAWKKLTETGYTHDGTNDKLSRAYYWGPLRKRGEGPDKAWAA